MTTPSGLSDKKRPTLADVARHAGVANSTASKALNSTGQISKETRQRVLHSAQVLGFEANQLAKSLSSGRSYTVGVVTTDSIGRFTIPILAGAEDALDAGQISMILCESRGDTIRENHYLRVLLARGVDGIIVTGRSSDTRPSLGVEFPIPVVYALTRSQDPNDLSVLHDDRGGAVSAVEHLIDQGRRRIVHITGSQRHSASQHRMQGAEIALAARGLQLAGGQVFYGEWSEQWGRQAIARIIRSHVNFDAVFCGNDQIARGVVDALRDFGINVPRDVAVVGVDNWDPMVEAARPPLTTIDLNLTEIGFQAAKHLIDAIEGRPIPQGVVLVPAQLIQRRSTETDDSVRPKAPEDQVFDD